MRIKWDTIKPVESYTQNFLISRKFAKKIDETIKL